MPEAVLQVSRAILTLPMIPVSDDRPTHEGSGGNLLDYLSSRLSAWIASTARSGPPSATTAFFAASRSSIDTAPATAAFLAAAFGVPAAVPRTV